MIHIYVYPPRQKNSRSLNWALNFNLGQTCIYSFSLMEALVTLRFWGGRWMWGDISCSLQAQSPRLRRSWMESPSVQPQQGWSLMVFDMNWLELFFLFSSGLVRRKVWCPLGEPQEPPQPAGAAAWTRARWCLPVRPVAGGATRGHVGAHAGGPGHLAELSAGWVRLVTR